MDIHAANAKYPPNTVVNKSMPNFAGTCGFHCRLRDSLAHLLVLNSVVNVNKNLKKNVYISAKCYEVRFAVYLA